MMLTLAAALLLVIPGILGLAYAYLTWHHSYWQKRGMATAQPLTLLGTYPSLLTGRRSVVYDVRDTYNKYKDGHRAVGVFLTRLPQLLILDPQLAHEMLVNNFSCYRDSITSSFAQTRREKYVGRNPFWAGGDYWKSQRVDAQGGLTPHKIKQGYAIWQSSGQKLLKYLAQTIKEQGAIIETMDLCYRFTADIMCDFIWGIDVGSLTRPHEPNPIMSMASKFTTSAFGSIGSHFASIAAPWLRGVLGMRFHPKDTDEFFARLTKESIDLRRKSPQQTRTDYLSHLLRLSEQKQRSQDDLVGHALTVMLDGYESTGGALLHALYYLAANPVAQQKLRAEILAHFDADTPITFETLSGLPYLDQCIYETLRLASLIPSFSKICTKATSIALTEQQSLEIEPGTLIMVPAYQFHYDEKYFPAAESFLPERFDNGAHRELLKQGVLLVFSDGPRTCLGIHIALLSLKVALACILSRYTLKATQSEIKKTDDAGFFITLAGNVLLEYKEI